MRKRESCLEESLPENLREGILHGREPPREPRREGYLLGICLPYHGTGLPTYLVCTPLPPSRVHPPSSRGHTGHRRSPAESPLTALTRLLAELTVRKRGVTVCASYLPVSLLVDVEREASMRRRVPLFLLGEEAMLRRQVLLSSSRFTVGRQFRT